MVFRDSEGKVGVLDENCPHRRASLLYGRNEEVGLRCLYHGWKFDTEGNFLEMSSEPAASGLREKVRHRSYPVKEWGSFVWAWLGPANAEPEFRPPRWAPTADVRVAVGKMIIPCNWAQILEGAIDSAHSSSLHSSDMVPAKVHSAMATDKNWLRPSTDKAPRLQVQRTGYGFRYTALRRPIHDAANHEYVRTTVFVAPNTVLIPPNNLYNVANVNVPMDDHTTAFYFIASGHPAHTPETETWRRFLHMTLGVDLDDQYRPRRTDDNRYLQDRQAMKAGNFTGIPGIPNQDMAMWVTMGGIADRSRDILGASDLAIAAFRDGGPAIGTGALAIPEAICSYQSVIPKSGDWRDYPAVPVLAAA